MGQRVSTIKYEKASYILRMGVLLWERVTNPMLVLGGLMTDSSEVFGRLVNSVWWESRKLGGALRILFLLPSQTCIFCSVGVYYIWKDLAAWKILLRGVTWIFFQF